MNLGTVARYLSDKEDIALVCAGWRGRMSLEDLLCAGNIIYEIVGNTLPETALDGAKVALGLYEKYGDDIEQAVQSSNHAKRLQNIVGEGDFMYCCKIDQLQVLPVMKDGMITDLNG